jgi:Holliday junction resolvase RusA-like endonuclease
MTVSFTVFCKPEPQGSTRAFIPKGWQRPIITSTNKALKPYRQQVARTALEVCQAANDVLPFGKHEPAELTVSFYFLRPPSIPKKRTAHVVKPDLDKLVRAIKDALKGIVYHDDSQVVTVHAHKNYGSPERTEITVRSM